MALGKKTSWQVPREASPGLAQALNNIRERFQNLEAEVTKFSSLIDVTKATKALQVLRQQIDALEQKIAALTGTAEVAAIAALLAQANGLVVLKDGMLITRVLEVGDGLSITNATGAGGNPRITNSTVPSTSPPSADGWDWVGEAGADLGVELS